MMKHLWILLTAVAAFVGAGCRGPNSDTALFHASGRAKPIVAVLPVIDSSGKQLVSWDISREMTDEIRKRIFTSQKVYLMREGASLEVAKEFNIPNPKELSNIPNQKLGDAEFVVVTELLDHDLVPYGLAGADKPHLEEVGAKLFLKMRVRVVDIRGDAPLVILQEVLHHEEDVARSYLVTDYEKNCWGTEAYERTPLGMIHNKMARELVARVEGYIGASKG